MGFSPAQPLPQLISTDVLGAGVVSQVFDAVWGPWNISTRPSPQYSISPTSRPSTDNFPRGFILTHHSNITCCRRLPASKPDRTLMIYDYARVVS